jgi:RHS repeat-associated protein
VSDTGNSRIQTFSEAGEHLHTLSWGKKPTGIATDSHGNVFVADYEQQKISEFNEKLELTREFGSTGEAPLEHPYALAITPQGKVLATSLNDKVEVFSNEGKYETQFGSAGPNPGQLQFAIPNGLAVLPNGDAWVTDSDNSRVEKWIAPSTASGNPGAHDTKTVYYSAKGEAEASGCREHPEYAGLPCQTEPAAQPGTAALPQLPVTKYNTYNIYDEPEQTVETIGSIERTTTKTYDAAGRLKTSAVSSPVGTALPTVTYEYNTTTGALTTQSAKVEGEIQKLSSVYNTVGQLTSYTDASKNTATYEYDVDGRLVKASDGKGTQTYTYNETSGLLDELVDSSAEGMKFTATYDVEGNMLTESYPNGMTANYTYSPTGTPVALNYIKTKDCTENCTWFSDEISPSIHGEWLTQKSTLSSEQYYYDAVGRLTQVEDMTSAGCATRDYVYDEDTNRTSLSTDTSSGECSTAASTTEEHTYDSADRLTDTGVKYNELSDITALPAADAGGGKELTSSYYTDNQLQSATQNEQTIGYDLDPAGRTIETIATGKPVDSTVTNHYAGPGDQPAWTSNLSGETTRNIPGINGQLVAVQNGSEAPVLQLTNLHGDIIATAYKSETATALASKADTTEYGVPTTSLPPKYSWLGALEIPTELPSGITAMGARSYVPQLGRFLQPDPIAGGSANAYGYTFGDPLNTADPSGAYTEILTKGDEEYGNEHSAFLVQKRETEIREEEEQRAAEEAAARAAAERRAKRAAEAAAYAGGPQYTGEEEWFEEEWWEEEGEYEYASYKHGAESGNEEHQLGSGVLYQPLDAETSSNNPAGSGSVMPLCEAVASGPCAQSVPDDHSPNVQSQCNRTGQHCSGRRGGGRGGGGNAGDTCRTVAGATGPLAVMTGPGGIILWAIGFGTCSLN